MFAVLRLTNNFVCPDGILVFTFVVDKYVPPVFVTGAIGGENAPV